MTFTSNLQEHQELQICLTNHVHPLRQEAHLQRENVSLKNERGYYKSLSGKNNKT